MRVRKTTPAWVASAYKTLLIFTVLAFSVGKIAQDMEVEAEFISPLSDVVVVEIEKPVYLYGQDVDGWVGKYVDIYFSGSRRSEVRMIMHCLLHRESGHGASNGMGDGGKAGGILQFHQPTWERMRKQMIKEGLITEIGDRFDKEQAINTTVWALKNGRGKEWGPIYREAKGSDFATCPMPSWY